MIFTIQTLCFLTGLGSGFLVGALWMWLLQRLVAAN